LSVGGCLGSGTGFPVRWGLLSLLARQGSALAPPHPAGRVPQRRAEDSPQLRREPGVAESRCSHPRQLLSCCQGGNAAVAVPRARGRSHAPKPAGRTPARAPALGCGSPCLQTSSACRALEQESGVCSSCSLFDEV